MDPNNVLYSLQEIIEVPSEPSKSDSNDGGLLLINPSEPGD